MTQGCLGAVLGVPDSTSSEKVEHKLPQRLSRPNQNAMGLSDSYEPSISPTVPPWAQETKWEASLTQLERSLAVVHSESELDADFYTVNQTFNLTSKVWKGEGTTKTPSSPEDLDVTLEVCRLEASSALEGNPLDIKRRVSHSPEYEIVQNHKDTNPVIGAARVPFPPTTDILADVAELAELSSITCSPAQLKESLYLSPLNRPLPPCNSTPRSPAPHQHVMGGFANASLLEMSPRVNCSSVALNTERTAQLCSASSMQTSPSSSILHTSAKADASFEHSDTLSSNHDFITASSGGRQQTSQDEAVSTYTVASITEEGHQNVAEMEEEEENHEEKDGAGEHEEEQREVEGKQGRQQREQKEELKDTEQGGPEERERGLDKRKKGDWQGDVEEDEEEDSRVHREEGAVVGIRGGG
ncbi:uncharacterized protein ACJ7VT_003166 [Polymixia lowei]